jgi:PPOX class probable F420-dependent enzyme
MSAFSGEILRFFIDRRWLAVYLLGILANAEIKTEVASMTATIPEKFGELFTKKAFAHLGTLMRDGSPQVTPVWCDYDGTHIRVNSAKGRVKDKNMRRNRKVALAIMDPDNPYRYLAVQGEVVEITEQGADVHIDQLAKKYLGKDKYPYRRPGEVRVIYKIRPQRVSTMG